MRVDGWQSLFSWTIIEPAPPEDFSQKNEKKKLFSSLLTMMEPKFSFYYLWLSDRFHDCESGKKNKDLKFRVG
jgi:hypothetical protein